MVWDKATNKEIKYCDSSMTDMCECTKSLSDSPDSATPANECVLFNIGLGRTRHSALTESVTLLLNELAPNSALYSPSGFKVVAGHAVYSVSRERNASGVPAFVQLTDPSGVITRFLFPDGESVGTPFAAVNDRDDWRLAMVDAQGWATAEDPAYYDFYPGDGSLWRFNASQASEDYLGLVSHQMPQGRIETAQDMGFEIIRDAEGVLRQVLTPAWLADFIVTGQDAYDLRLYPNDVSCVPGSRAGDGCYVIAQGVEADVVWEFRNPVPGVPRDLSVTKKKGAASETWLYRYEEAVQDFTLVYPQGVMEKRLERAYSDDRKSWTVKRTLTASGGKVARSDLKRFTSGTGGSLLRESVRDPGGLNLTTHYDYYQDAILNRRLKGIVNDGGSWSRYEYDGLRRKTADIRPWLDAPTNATPEQCAVTRYDYAPVVSGDILLFNDQRPRTVIEEICGVEVSRTYHAYPTNELRQSQSITERAAFPGAPYGHPSNPRTVKTYHAAFASLPLTGRLATVTYPGGRTETYGYEYGTFNAATFAFTPAPEGGAWRETVTTAYPSTPNSSFLTPNLIRRVAVWDEKGREVLNESYVADGDAFALTGWKRMSYNRNGKPTETVHSDGRVESASWGANCCGVESETAADGTITVYGYNTLKQKVSETRKGIAPDGSGDITTLYVYDLEGRILSSSVTNIAAGLGHVDSRRAYDAAGRVTNQTDRLGNATRTSYAALSTAIVNPRGVTSVTARYPDGRTKRVLENGTVKQSHAYGVNSDGSQWTLTAQGALPATITSQLLIPNSSLLIGLDVPWSLTVSDMLDRTVASHKPGFGGTILVTSNAYDIAGNLISTTQYVESPLLSTPYSLLSQTLYAYYADGSRHLTALDINTNGVIDLDGPDRVTGTSSVYEKDSSNLWWQTTRSWVYPAFNSATAVTASTQRTLLTGLGVPASQLPITSNLLPFTSNVSSLLTSYSVSIDTRGNATTFSTFIDRTARTVNQITLSPTSIQPSLSTTVNGLLISTVSSTAVANTFAYDGLARRVATTDGRDNTTITAYNSLGQVAYTEDAASSRTTFTYDPLGRRTEVTDALGNTTYTDYDTDNRVIATWGATYPVRYEYDAYGRMTAMRTYRSETGGAGASPAGAAMPDPSGGDTTRWLYDAPTGLLTNKLYPDSLGTAYTYTPDGKLATRLWARGIVTSYSYVSLSGELAAVEYSDDTPDIAYMFNRLGNMSSVTDASGIRTFTNDPIGRTLTDSIHFQNETFTLHEAHDTFGRSAGYVFSNTVDGVSSLITGTSLEHDPFGRITICSVDNIPTPFRYTYQPGSGMSQSLAMPNGATRQTVYDPSRDLPMSITQTNVTGAILTHRTFSYDVVGRLAGRTQYRFGDETNRLDAFGYNPRSELAQAIIGTNDYTYLFDPIGNREQSVENAVTNLYTANEVNRYTAISTSALSTPPREFVPEFDADGNQTLLRTTTGIWHVTYNAENRPVRFTGDDGTTVIDMAYDYMGRRFLYRETVSGTVIRHERYLYRGYLQIAALDMLNVAAVIHTVVWDPAEPTATRPLLLSTPDGWFTYGFDQVKNVTELFDSSGNIVATYDYSPFGEIIAATGTAAALNPIRFSSEIYDSALDLVQYNYRPLNPTDGRFANRDPAEESGGKNLHGVVGNDPINRQDYLGRMLMPRRRCCGDKVYFEDSQCCVEESRLAWEFLDLIQTTEYVVYNKEPLKTGVTRYVWKGSGAGRKPMHHWIAWPGGTADVNGISVLNPLYENNIVVSPATIPSGSNESNTKAYPIKISPCEYDLLRFAICIDFKIQSMKGRPFHGGLCDAFVDVLVGECKQTSKRQ